MPLSRRPIEGRRERTPEQREAREPQKNSRVRPDLEVLEDQIQHSYQHRGDTGKFGNIYKVDVGRWKVGEGKHEFCIVPYRVYENSVFRTGDRDWNKPIPKEKLDAGKGWAHKLTVLIHTNIGVNQDQVLCLRTLSRDCPICAKRAKIKEALDDETRREVAEGLQKQVDSLSPMKRAIYNIFSFDSEEDMNKGVQIWEAPHQSIEDVICEMHSDERTGEKRIFEVPDYGWNILFTKTGKGLATKYTAVNVVKRQARDEFSDADLDKLYEQAMNLEEIIDIKSPEELVEMMVGFKEEAAPANERPDKVGRREEPEERPREDRFRGRERLDRSRKEEPPPPEEEPEPEKGSGNIPAKYVQCFGVLCNQRDPECDQCPQELFESCYGEYNKKGKK
jgi:hypothetical protein